MRIFKPHQKLTFLASVLPHNPIIVEAGAFTGNDTVGFIKQWPNATIHAFEPVAQLYHQLLANTQHIPSIHCHQQALSTANGYAQLHILSKKNTPEIPSQAGSLHAPSNLESAHASMYYSGTITVKTCTLDTFFATHHLTHIDLLWLDLQGHELAVLQHASETLAHIAYIYTEVNCIDRYKDQPTYQMITEFLIPYNFLEYARDFINPAGHRFGNVLFKNMSTKR